MATDETMRIRAMLTAKHGKLLFELKSPIVDRQLSLL
jgi:hypothetical protein